MRKKTPKIICPKCGTQYLPGEIYLPESFLGQPNQIIKNCYGEILDYYGGSMNLSETYQCDKCDTVFSVKATVQFNTSVKDELNIKTPYKTKFSKEKLILPE